MSFSLIFLGVQLLAFSLLSVFLYIEWLEGVVEKPQRLLVFFGAVNVIPWVVALWS